MKVQELLANLNKSKELKDEQKINLIFKLLNVKTYLSFNEKMDLIDSVIRECVIYENNIYSFNNITLYVTFTMYVIGAYTDLELSEDIIKDYDLLCENKYIDLILNTFDADYQIVKTFFKTKCNDILQQNNFNNQSALFFKDVLEIIDNSKQKIEKFFENLVNAIDEDGVLMNNILSQDDKYGK